MKERPVYSTDKSQSLQSKPQKQNTKPSSGPLRVRRETKSRGGKTATVLYNLPFSNDESKAQMKELQNLLACGASLKNQEIILQGDFIDKVLEFYAGKNIKIIKSGG